jgi:hypothetical protein
VASLALVTVVVLTLPLIAAFAARNARELPPLTVYSIGQLGVVAASAALMRAFSLQKPLVAAGTGIALLFLLLFLGLVLPTSPSECAAYLQGLNHAD